ncbi:carboxypeptidase-like regulatory domain-containing protein [Thermococcus barophilus]|uniref:Uncharacterized protein n=1 Tax=Thermococcus barophilus (strain DSM 11836 / MP) TaxID=391623 RepID=F0LM00_THEBM|nr:carboxypeptidase-like regulatory domain-containing protein [Thermococcus barophilus]ADT85099.1 hypothetical protein TERMP_02125 [Thermococcus barophilus MP]
MNRRNRARFLSVLLAVLMLLSAVPMFTPEVVAQTYPTTIKIVGNATNCGVKLFQGFPYEIVMNISYLDSSGNVTAISSNVYARIYYYNTTSGSWILAYETPDPGFSVQNGNATIIINSTLSPGFVSNEYREIPQGITMLRVTLYDPVYNISASTDFAVLFPYTVSTTITSTVPYLNGTWMYDRAFKEIPFNLTVNVTYDSDAVTCFGIAIPSNVTVDITMPNGSVISDTLPLTNGTGEKVYANLESSVPGTGNVVVTDSLNGLTAPPEYFQVYDWNINFFTISFSLTYPPYAWIPFNLSGTVNAYTTFGGLGTYTLGVNDTIYLVLLNNTIFNTTAIMTNGTAPFNITDIILPGGTDYALYASMGNYSPETTYYFNVSSWDIEITPTITCTSGGAVCDYFYAGVNQTLNITINYPVSPYNITSTANYSVLLNGVEMYSGNITIINNTGSVEFPVNFPENGTVVVKVWDETYHPEVNNVTLEVKDWGIGYGYLVEHYPGTWYSVFDDKFYVGIPADLNLTILYNEPCPVNSTLEITLLLPNGTVLTYNVTVTDSNMTNFAVPQTFLFSEPGFVVVTYNDTTLGKSVTFSIPVRDWGIFVDASPEELTQDESVNLNVFVVESLYFDWPGERNVTVTLELPDGYVETKNLTLEANDDIYGGQGGYQGIITFENVTPTMPGIAWVTVTDVLSGKSVKMPIKVNAAITPGNKWIDVTATPANEPVYAYIGNSLRIELQYMYSDGIAAYKDYDDHIVNVTITDADGTEYFLQLPVDNGYLLIPSYAIPVNGTNDIAIEVVDAYNSSITGGTVVPVTQWNVTFDFATNGTVWEYVDNTLYVTVHVNGPNVPVDVSINGDLYTNVADGQVIEYPITDPQGTLVYNVIATYNGHQVGSDTYTVLPQEWNVTFDFATNGTVWEYVDNTLYVTVHVNGPNVPVDVSINGDLYTNVADGQVISVDIVDPMGILTYNVTAIYNGHQVSDEWIHLIQVRSWNVTFEFSYADAATGIGELYQGFNARLNVTVHVNGPDVPVDIWWWTWNLGNYTDGSVLYLGFGPVPAVITQQFKATYEGHIVGNDTFVYSSATWSTEVSAPDELYYLPDGYTNMDVKIGVDLAGLPEIITGGYNVTIELNVTLPNGTVIHRVVNGTNSTVFDLGDLTFNESGVVTYVVKVYKHVPWPGGPLYEVGSASGTIPIELALDAVITGTYYENIPMDFVVNVYSISDSPDITVTISGTNYTVTADHDGVLTIPNVTLEAGNYTVIITDASLNATITRTLEVRNWGIYVVPTPTNITAGSVYTVTFDISLIDQYGQPVVVNDKIRLRLEFSDTDIIPSGFYDLVYYMDIADNGHLTKTVSVFSPVAGTFQVIVSDKYGKMNNTEQIIVNEPNPADLTYVYVNIRKQGSLNPPEEPVKLYWGLELGGVRKYFPVFNATISDDYSEAMFALYPQSPFSLYVIATPLNVTAPILTENEPWVSNITVQNETITTYTKNVTVIPIEDGWNISVSVYKATLHNVTIEHYLYNVPITPGVIQLQPGSASVQGNAIYAGLSVEPEHYEEYIFGPYETANSTMITIEPNELMLMLIDNTTLKPTQAGEYFTFKAMLSITNAEEQFNAQWMPFESWIQAIGFLNDTEKGEIISEILDQIGNVSALNGPVANETLDFHIDNTDIAYLEPTNATTDEMGSVVFKVYTQATPDMTPEELSTLMGAVDVWATYGDLESNHITVNFGGTGSISGDITDDSGMQIAGATVIVKIWNGTAWVNATDFEGNVLVTVSAEDGHYALNNVPAEKNGTEYMVVAKKGNLTGYAYVTVYPFATSTADIKLGGEAQYAGIAMYKEKVETADTVYFVFNNLGTPDAFSVSQYVSRTVPITTRTVSLLAEDFNMSAVTANDVVISVGGPLVNPVTAAYENIAPVHMVIDGKDITIVSPQGNVTWTAPTPWWNVTEGYFIIQLFTDENSGALVVTIYGTDADSTAAGAYYFLTEVYPNIAAYNSISYIVGKWEDTEAGADIPLPGANLGDTSGFSAGDTITVIFIG